MVDKPVGISSFEIIRQLRNKLGIKKIGHAGTLDPLASGLLIVLIGGVTKQQARFMKLDKVYEAEITLGAVSTTDDAEGDIQVVSSQETVDRRPTQSEVEKVLKSFVGEIKQLPPRFSALKIKGQRAYKLARAGQAVNLSPRTVRIHSLKLVTYDWPKLRIVTLVSSGTYIRSLARDIGAKLGTGAYLSGLRRTAIGDYKIDSAIKLDKSTRPQIEAAIQLSKN